MTVACVASVFMRFRCKEQGTRVKDQPSLHLARGHNRKFRSSVFLCSETTRKSLLCRLRRWYPLRSYMKQSNPCRKILMNGSPHNDSHLKPNWVISYISKRWKITPFFRFLALLKTSHFEKSGSLGWTWDFVGEPLNSQLFIMYFLNVIKYFHNVKNQTHSDKFLSYYYSSSELTLGKCWGFSVDMIRVDKCISLKGLRNFVACDETPRNGSRAVQVEKVLVHPTE